MSQKNGCYKLTIRLVSIFSAWLLLAMVGVSNISSQETPGSAYNEALRRALVGTWRGEIGGEGIEFAFKPDGTYSIGSSQGTYTVATNTLSLTDDTTITYQISLSGRDSLTLSGGDIGAQARFQKLADTSAMLASFLRVNPANFLDKIFSIGMIVVIVLASRLILFLLERLSQGLIFSERGLLRYIYSANKSRTRTIHSLTLDIVKYIVYFTAIGFVLSEIGVNYTAYLASLSVIGLAIGFGSQGLVQDIVTGFFLVFEDQFNVGDMVEISGQIGIVQEMGLRMTRILNYAGQIVFIPNRNIAIAGRYIAGALQGYIDCGIDGDATDAATRVTMEVASAISKQFDNVFLSSKFETKAVTAESGKNFLRCSFAIWPGQTWIVDQHLIPRLKSAFSEESITLNPDLPSVCYHIRNQLEIKGVGVSISQMSRRFRRASQSGKI